MAKSLPTPFNPPPPTTLLMWRHCFADAKRRRLESNLTLSRCGSRWVKFDFKFERKKIRRSIFALDEALFKFGDGSYLVGNYRAKFKSNEV